ncbi:MAG: hypothetical protein ACXVOI_08955, partial [Tumebacillaceae bacterium]
QQYEAMGQQFQQMGASGAAAGGLGALALGFGGGAFGTLGAGLSMFTPAGWAMLLGGALLGGAVGGMIGPHWGPATNYPDRSDTQHYGGFVADINGAAGTFNGQTIGPQSQYSTAGGGLRLSDQMVNWAAQNANNTANLTQAQQQLEQQIKALEINGNTNLGITNEKNGMFTLASGAQISVQQYEAMGSQFQQMGASGAAAAPVFTISRTYPDYNLANGGGLTGDPTAALPKGPVSKLPPGMGPITSHGGDVHITVNGSVIGGTPEDIAQKFSQIMRAQSDGSTFGSVSLNRRTYGDFR